MAAHRARPRVDDRAAPAAGRRRGRARTRRAARCTPRTGPAYGSARTPATRRTRGGACGRAPGPRASPADSACVHLLWASGRPGPAGRARARGRWRRRPTTVTAARSASRGAASSWAQPVASSCSASTLRANPPTRAAASSTWARVSSTSRAWGYGARGSAWRSSPSSQIATSPRSCTGANAAARVPTTIRRVPRATARNSR